MSRAADRLIVALDFSDLSEAERMVKTLSPEVKLFKVGKELFTAAGPRAVEMIRSNGGGVFLDLKFHDIPNTVGAACEAAVRQNVMLLNVHASGGKAMLFQAVKSVHQTAEKMGCVPPILLGVTVLTSLTDADLLDVGISRKLSTQVERLAELCQECGLDGVVASGQEIDLIRRVTGPDFRIVTPGVRPVWAAHGDQKRIVTPKEAVERGADYIVVGRPITQNADPRAAAKKVLEEIA